MAPAVDLRDRGAEAVLLAPHLDVLLELGADHVVNARQEDTVEAVRKLNNGKGVDYVVECSGAPNAVNDAIRSWTFHCLASWALVAMSPTASAAPP